MIAAFVIIYSLAILIVFKGFKIKPRPIPIAVAVVIGVVFIGAIVIGWQFSAPVSKNTTVVRYVVQLVPEVTGTIKTIHAEPNAPLIGGRDLLFEIDSELYRYEVDRHTARLGSARQTVMQSEAALEATAASVKQSEAEYALAKAEVDTAVSMQRADAGAVAELRVTSKRQKFKAAEATVAQAIARRKEAGFALEAAKENIRTIEAELDIAKYNLEKCTVTAPADGFVTYWSMREGTRVSSMRNASIGTFIDTSDAFILANYPQHLLKNVKPGDAVDIAFMSLPGQVVTGTVETLIGATGEGQFAPTGNIPVAADVGSRGSLLVKIRLDDEAAGAQLPLGAGGAVAIFTTTGKPFQAVSKIYMRMTAWLFYLP